IDDIQVETGVIDREKVASKINKYNKSEILTIFKKIKEITSGKIKDKAIMKAQEDIGEEIGNANEYRGQTEKNIERGRQIIGKLRTSTFDSITAKYKMTEKWIETIEDNIKKMEKHKYSHESLVEDI